MAVGRFIHSFSSIDPSATSIVYGTEGCAFTSRAFYTFKRLCQTTNDVYLMQGSLKEWIEAGGKIESGEKKSTLYSDLSDDKNSDTNSGYAAIDDVNSVTMD